MASQGKERKGTNKSTKPGTEIYLFLLLCFLFLEKVCSGISQK